MSAFPDLARSFSAGARGGRPGAAATSPDHVMALAEDIAPDIEPDVLRLDHEVVGAEEEMPASSSGAPAACRSQPQWPVPVTSPFALDQPGPQQAEWQEQAEGGCPLLQPQDRQNSAMRSLPSLTLGGSTWQERVRSSTAAATPLHPWQQQQGAGQQSSQQQPMDVGGGACKLPIHGVKSRIAPAGSDSASSMRKRSEAWPQGILSSMFKGALRSGSLSACSMEQDDLAVTRRQLSLKNSLSLNMDQMVST